MTLIYPNCTANDSIALQSNVQTRAHLASISLLMRERTAFHAPVGDLASSTSSGRSAATMRKVGAGQCGPSCPRMLQVCMHSWSSSTCHYRHCGTTQPSKELTVTMMVITMQRGQGLLSCPAHLRAWTEQRCDSLLCRRLSKAISFTASFCNLKMHKADLFHD